MSKSLTLRDDPAYAAADDTVREAKRTLEAAVADEQHADAEVEKWKALHADHALATRQDVEPATIREELPKAEARAHDAAGAKVRAQLALSDAREERRRCAEQAAENMGAIARERLAEIQTRHSQAKAEMEQAAKEEGDLIQTVNDALRPAFGYDRTASNYGVKQRPAVG